MSFTRRHSRTGRIALLGACVLSVVVAQGPACAQGTSERVVQGFVKTGDASGIWTLRRCGSAIDVPLQDRTPGDALTVGVAEVKRVMQDPRRGVFVEFEGSTSANEAVAHRLWRVLGHVSDCAKVPSNVASDVRLWATGDDPDWRLVVRGAVATFTRFGGERLAFPAAPLTPQVPRRSYEAQSGSTRLTVEIDEALCVDAVAEAAYGARVTATVLEKGKTRRMTGCAARY